MDSPSSYYVLFCVVIVVCIVCYFETKKRYKNIKRHFDKQHSLGLTNQQPVQKTEEAVKLKAEEKERLRKEESERDREAVQRKEEQKQREAEEARKNQERLKEEERLRKEEGERIREANQRKAEEKQREAEEARKNQERREQEERQQAISLSQQRASQAFGDFVSARVKNGFYVPESGGVGFLISAGIITYDCMRNQWISAREGYVQFYETTSHSEFSGYHDEDNTYYSTKKIEMSKTWNETNWFTRAFGLSDDDFDQETTTDFPYDAFYYEGVGEADLNKWERRIWMETHVEGRFIIYLRRCEEGYRLLRLFMDKTEFPFEFRFTEKDIFMLYHKYGDQCTLFEDFLLSSSECRCIADAFRKENGNGQKAEDCNVQALHAGKYITHALRLGSINACFVQGKDSEYAGTICPGSDLIKALLKVRCRDYNDYWGYTPS